MGLKEKKEIKDTTAGHAHCRNHMADHTTLPFKHCFFCCCLFLNSLHIGVLLNICVILAYLVPRELELGLDALKVELQEVVSYHIGAGPQTQVF